MAKESIAHSGKVLEINPQFITVEILSQSACASCHAAGLCGMSEAQKKEVIVRTPSSEFYEIGEEVTVTLESTMGYKAVWIAYMVPLVVLLTGIFVSLGCGLGELASALVGIGVTAVYYFVIWLLRDKLRDQYVFEISKKQ